MNVHTQKSLIAGPVGQIVIAIDLPDAVRDEGAAPRGIAPRGSRAGEMTDEREQRARADAL